MNIGEEVAAFARNHLNPILDMSGKVLYSGVETLKEGTVYLLGHNPGGSPIGQATETIRNDLDALPTRKENAYIDESWLGRPPGSSPLQVRVRWLLEALGLNPQEVAASNMVFVRSVDAAGSQFSGHANLCWPVHERIIEVVKPRLLIVFGNSGSSPYTYLAQKFRATGERSSPSGHANWTCRSFRVSGRFRVAGLPHLSRYKVIGKESIVHWLRSFWGKKCMPYGCLTSRCTRPQPAGKRPIR
jgi:hypothetical protein